MVFTSFTFLLFVAPAFAAFWLARNHGKIQNAILIVASSLFYGWWDWRMLALLLGNTIWAYGWGAVLSARRNRLLLAVAAAGPLAVLFVFKYFDFFVPCAHLGLAVPVGLSFYTFMAVGYLADVWCGRIGRERDPLAFGAFMMFFPQLAAGPIGRAGEMLPQYRRPRTFDYPLAVDGCRQFLWGMFKKMFVAAECAVVADRAFAGYAEATGLALILGAVCYSIQIYADFSGYSDMAIGVGKVFGIRLRRNFDYPYFACGIGDFWRRWHMSLTSWFKDYVYIPLGGSRCGLLRNLANVWTVFLLSGLWHGAAWTFVIWGALHAAFLSVQVVFARKLQLTVPSPVGWLITFVAVAMAWVFFRAPDFATAIGYFAGMFSNPLLPAPSKALSLLPKVAAFMAVEWIWRKREHPLAALPNRFRALRWLLYLVIFVTCLSRLEQSGNFIYFEF